MMDTTRLAPTRRLAAAVAIIGLALVASKARADRITLKGGGQLRGKLMPDKAHPGRFLVFGETGRAPMTLAREQVAEVTPEKGPLDEYVTRLGRDRPTADEEYDLGLWCLDHKLPDLAPAHFEAALALDDAFAPAHEKLGHVLKDGQWLDLDAQREAQGLVKYRGRWVTTEQRDRKEAQLASAAEGAGWTKRIKALRDGYLNGPSARSDDAERRLLEIREPVAVSPVMKLMGDHPIPAVRILAARVLGAIPGPAATSGLVARLLAEFDDAVRGPTMAELARRDADEVVPALVRALRSAEAAVVNRAAWGLSNLNAVATVPKLIPALVTVEYRVMMVPSAGGVGGGSNAIFNSVSPSQGSTFQGSSFGATSTSIPVLTPPVVGPNAVAFGVTSVPYGAYNNSGVNLGGGGGTQAPSPRVVPIQHLNAEVHDALVRMTGHDFGFDMAGWKRWMTTSFRVETGPTRRVLKP